MDHRRDEKRPTGCLGSRDGLLSGDVHQLDESIVSSAQAVLSGYRSRLASAGSSFTRWLGSVSLELRCLLGARRDVALARCPRTRCFAASPAVRATSLNAVQGTPWRRR